MNTPKSQEQVLLETLERFINKQVLERSYIEIAQKWFIDLAITLIEHQKSTNVPIIVGINGCQGSGKSTLSALLVDVISEVFDVSCVAFSIDDFYLSKQDRLSLAKIIHPLLATRGVPGTHDIALLESVLNSLVKQKDVSIPVFDKSIDDIKPVQDWINVTHKPQIIILEGWCVGINGQQRSQLLVPVNELEEQEDASGQWREFVNDNLSTDYKRVFSSLDYLIMLKAPSFEHVYSWRCEQEHKLIASLATDTIQCQHASSTMTDNEIFRFIQFYQRLTEHALRTLPAKSNRVFALNEHRGITQCR